MSFVKKDKDFYGSQTHDVFLIHSNQTEDRAFTLKTLKPMLEAEGLKVMTDDDFRPGKDVFKSIAYAIKSCRKSLIVLTQANESSWCSLELILALEKSHTLDIMSVVILRKGEPSELHVHVLDYLHGVQVIDIEGNLYEERCQEIVEKLRETKRIAEVLPAGNFAHAQVWSHFTGYLQYLLPEIKRLIQETDLYKNNKSKFPLKLYELIPENGECHRVVSDNTGWIKVAGQLPKLEYKRAGNSKVITVTVYCVADFDGTEYYCVAEYPATLAGIQQMINEKGNKTGEGGNETSSMAVLPYIDISFDTSKL